MLFIVWKQCLCFCLAQNKKTTNTAELYICIDCAMNGIFLTL